MTALQRPARAHLKNKLMVSFLRKRINLLESSLQRASDGEMIGLRARYLDGHGGAFSIGSLAATPALVDLHPVCHACPYTPLDR
jgi:hypothetical protein